MSNTNNNKKAKLRGLWKKSQKEGAYTSIQTKDLKKIAKHLDSAIESLIIFPECDSALYWLIHRKNQIDSYIDGRNRLENATNEKQ